MGPWFGLERPISRGPPNRSVPKKYGDPDAATISGRIDDQPVAKIQGVLAIVIGLVVLFNAYVGVHSFHSQWQQPRCCYLRFAGWVDTQVGPETR